MNTLGLGLATLDRIVYEHLNMSRCVHVGCPACWRQRWSKPSSDVQRKIASWCRRTGINLGHD